MIIILGFVTIGNSQNTLLYVDNSSDNANALEIRIYTPDFRNVDGFFIYRKSDNSPWQLLNEKAITMKESKDIGGAMDDDKKQILDLLNSDEKIEEGLILLVLATYVIQNKDLADAVGTRYVDDNLTNGVSYTYKVVNARTGKKIAESAAFTKGEYSPMLPPEKLKIYQNGNKYIEFEWQPKPLAFYGINIYRSMNSEEAKKLNERPILLSKIEDESGNKLWPKIKFTDKDLELGNTYSYQIGVLDYFGNLGQLSKPIIIDFKDVEPPSPTKGLLTSIDNKNMAVYLKWKKNTAKDLKGYNVYYFNDKDSIRIELNKTLISADSTVLSFSVANPGDYSFWVAAIDSSENISISDTFAFTVEDKMPPEIPKNCSFELKNNGRIKISWQSEQEGDFMTYRVYRKESKAKHFVLMTASKFDSTVFMDRIDLSVKNAFQYYIIAMDTLYNKSDKSKIITVKYPDVTPPGKPFLKNVSLSNDSIIIVWRENKDDDLSGYNVYFHNDNDTIKINNHLITKKKYTDSKTHSEDVLKYVITAIDSNGNESEFSNPFLLKKAYKSMADGDFAKIKVKSKKGSREVNISWKFKEENPPVGFVIYRAENQGKFKPVSGMTKETQFKDKVSKSGTYKYKVTAIYSSGDKLNSEIKEITINE